MSGKPKRRSYYFNRKRRMGSSLASVGDAGEKRKGHSGKRRKGSSLSEKNFYLGPEEGEEDFVLIVRTNRVREGLSSTRRKKTLST